MTFDQEMRELFHKQEELLIELDIVNVKINEMVKRHNEEIKGDTFVVDKLTDLAQCVLDHQIDIEDAYHKLDDLDERIDKIAEEQKEIRNLLKKQ